MKSNNMYRLEDVIMMSGLSERTVRRHLKEGLLSGSKLGGTWQFNEADIKAYMERKTTMGLITQEASEQVKMFLKGAMHSMKTMQVCTIIDMHDLSQAKLSTLRQQVLDISNANPTKFTMKFNTDKKITRITLTGDADYVEKVLDAAKAVA